MRHAVTHYPLNFFLATTIFLCHTIYFWLIISCYSGQTAQVSPGTVEVKGVLSDTIAARIWKKSQYWLFDRDFFQIPRPGRLIETKNWPWQPWNETVQYFFFCDGPGRLIETFWKNSDKVIWQNRMLNRDLWVDYRSWSDWSSDSFLFGKVAWHS